MFIEMYDKEIINTDNVEMVRQVGYNSTRIYFKSGQQIDIDATFEEWQDKLDEINGKKTYSLLKKEKK